MDKNKLENIVDRFSNVSVLVIGDIMLDRFVYGNVDRISPESPVPVLSINRQTTMLGGAGNVAANLAGLGATPYVIAAIGNDAEGRDIRDLLDQAAPGADHMAVFRNRPTTVKTRHLAGHQQLLRTDYEDKTPLEKEQSRDILASVKNIIDKIDVVILSDYGKGVLTDELIRNLMAETENRKIPVFVDPKGTDYSRYRGAYAVTPNKKELSDATSGHATDTDSHVESTAKQLIDSCGVQNVIATRAADGISVISQADKAVHIRTRPVEVFDVSGAGDTVIAVAATATGAGAGLPEAAMLANLAGGVVVSKVGTAIIRQDDILDALADEAGGNTPAKELHNIPLYGRDEAREQIERWHARGLKVGLTNGCFDILHYGHVSYLDAAKGSCDRLIVALNSDESVTRLKGTSRPVNDQTSRAGVLGALGAVDMVVLFGDRTEDDDKATAVVELLQPDIYFKGGDYRIEQIPEATAVKAYGGEVEIMKLYDGHSTTATIEKINKKA